MLEGGAFLADAALQVIMPLVEQHALAQEKAQLALAKAQAALPVAKACRVGGVAWEN